jgi:ubiquinone/menaquinone biosynthesis C-methylase UbiE
MRTIANDTASVEVFMKSWRVYQEIIKHNYMFHREISKSVSNELGSYRHNEQLHILDLGCGDGSMTLPLLSANRIASYIGCDLSKPALDIAQDQINVLGISARLLCDDMLNIVHNQPGKSFDLIYCSYAIHHLNGIQKQQIVEDIARVLKPGGLFVLIDVFREPTEDRAAYMKHYMGHLRLTWTDLSPESQDLVVDHATSYDFPETHQFYESLCHKQGFGKGKYLAKHTWHEAWVYTKN